MLNNDEVLSLLKLARQGDENAKSQLIEQNSPLIKSVVRIYKNKGVEYEDLYQLGVIGFLKAMKNFDGNFNVKFTTYAVPMIAGEIKRFIRDDGAIKISRSPKTLQMKLNKYICEYRKINCGESPSLEELSKHFNTPIEEIVLALECNKPIISLDERIDENDERSRTVIESVAGEDETDKILDHLMLKNIIQNLPLRDKQIIYLRYYKEKSQSEIAKVLNVSQVQVSRLENKLLEKIRSKMM